MSETNFELKKNMKHFFDVNEDMWEKVQELYYGKNPINEALAKLNAEDMALFFEKVANSPMHMMQLQMKWWQGQLDIYRNVMLRSVDSSVEPVAFPQPDDRRFNDELWKEQPQFDYLSQSYLHFSKLILEMLDVVDDLPDKVRYRLHFFTRQIVNALSPSNFFWTNPEVIQQTIEEKGENLVRGAQTYCDDVKNSGHYLSVRMVDREAFDIGKDLAYTAGSVVFENEVCQLIQYKAATTEVYQTPLLIVPPFINKYYILDLREKNSFVHWLCSQGHTVFLISWRNPTAEQKDMSFDDLLIDGVTECVNVIEDITGEKEVNAIGYCIGGTLLASVQAYYIARRLKNRIKSATYMTTLLDFSNPGSLGAFINESVIAAVEAMNDMVGYCDGRHIAVTFSLLRENTLYWNYYIDNYLRGKDPSEFDILYWNSDGTNVSPKIHSFLLRTLYLNNELIEPNKIKIGDGVGINLSRVKTPSFFVSCQQDHIALWDATFAGAQHLGGDCKLVLTESGHVAGIVNPPSRNKYGYYTNDEKYQNSKQWVEKAVFHQHSWWIGWQEWVEKYAGEKIPARAIGSSKYKEIEAAPGRYVKCSIVS